LTTEDKLASIKTLGSIAGVSQLDGWSVIVPDSHGDWLKQRDDTASQNIIMGSKKTRDTQPCLFENYSLGVGTNRDAWVYGFSSQEVVDHVNRMAVFYNAELDRFEQAHPGLDKKTRAIHMDRFVSTDPARISWSSSLKDHFARGTRTHFAPERMVVSLYRAFTKEWLYFGPHLIHRPGQMPNIFPHASSMNRVIACSASESRSAFSVLMSDTPPSLHAADSVGTQCFPPYLYEDAETETCLFPGDPQNNRRDAITDAGLAHFQEAYPAEPITKEDLFYYVYGILCSPDYRELFADNLGKELPRIPRVSTAAAFWAFSKAGRALGELHVGYERVPEYAATLEGPPTPTPAQYRVVKMKFGKGKDKSIIHYNDALTVKNIPLEAYSYIVNGKSAIEWVMDRQTVSKDKASGIVKDANTWAIETVGDPRYPLSLLLRVITVSLETHRIVATLPALELLDTES